jgi:hypothetical protein
MTSLNLGQIDIGGGLSATKAWVVGGPVVLVSTSTSSGIEQNSRLDIAKGMFIDPLPGTRLDRGIAEITRVIMAEGRWRF